MCIERESVSTRKEEQLDQLTRALQQVGSCMDSLDSLFQSYEARSYARSSAAGFQLTGGGRNRPAAEPRVVLLFGTCSDIHNRRGTFSFLVYALGELNPRHLSFRLIHHIRESAALSFTWASTRFSRLVIDCLMDE